MLGRVSRVRAAWAQDRGGRGRRLGGFARTGDGGVGRDAAARAAGALGREMASEARRQDLRDGDPSRVYPGE